MHPQLHNGLNYESKGENNERRRSWGTHPSSQHFRGREGHVGASRWD